MFTIGHDWDSKGTAYKWDSIVFITLSHSRNHHLVRLSSVPKIIWITPKVSFPKFHLPGVPVSLSYGNSRIIYFICHDEKRENQVTKLLYVPLLTIFKTRASPKNNVTKAITSKRQ